MITIVEEMLDQLDCPNWEFLNRVCMWYDHEFGLYEEAKKQQIREEIFSVIQALVKELRFLYTSSQNRG